MTAAVLSRPTLVLNRNWQPVGVSSVARALIKVWNDTARIVDPHDYQLYTWSDWAKMEPAAHEPRIMTQQFALRVPEVVTLTNYDRVPAKVVTFSRRNVFKRDRYTCQYCGRQPGSEELTIDHVTPRAQGGETNWDNCVLACIECNARKANRTPDQAGMPLMKRPARPLWKPIYGRHDLRIDSWSKFVSAAYWNVELDD